MLFIPQLDFTHLTDDTLFYNQIRRSGKKQEKEIQLYQAPG